MTLAFLFIECVKDQAENVKKLVKQVQDVSEAHATSSGGFDVVVKVQTEDDQRFKTAVDAVKGIAGIIAVVTAIAYGNVN